MLLVPAQTDPRLGTEALTPSRVALPQEGLIPRMPRGAAPSCCVPTAPRPCSPRGRSVSLRVKQQGPTEARLQPKALVLRTQQPRIRVRYSNKQSTASCCGARL